MSSLSILPPPAEDSGIQTIRISDPKGVKKSLKKHTPKKSKEMKGEEYGE